MHRKISVHTVYKYTHGVSTWKKGVGRYMRATYTARVRKSNRNKPGQGDPKCFFLKTYIRPTYYYNVLLCRRTRRMYNA